MYGLPEHACFANSSLTGDESGGLPSVAFHDVQDLFDFFARDLDAATDALDHGFVTSIQLVQGGKDRLVAGIVDAFVAEPFDVGPEVINVESGVDIL